VAAETRLDPADLVNAAIDALILDRCELPSLSTLLRLTIVTIDFATKALNLPIRTESGALRSWYELVSVRASMSA